MIKNKFIPDMDNIQSLKEFSFYIKELTKKYSQKEIIEKSGVDKNVLYRILNQQNITLDNYYKLVKAFPDKLVEPSNPDIVSDLPLLGQLVENDKIKVLNLSQPRSVPVPSAFVEAWSPVFGYLITSSTFYSGMVAIFTTKGLNDIDCINDQCVNRMIMAYPEDKDPVYGMVVKTSKCYQVLHARERTVIIEVPFKNKIKWAKFMCVIPFSLMENVHDKDNCDYHQKLTGLEKDFFQSHN